MRRITSGPWASTSGSRSTALPHAVDELADRTPARRTSSRGRTSRRGRRSSRRCAPRAARCSRAPRCASSARWYATSEALPPKQRLEPPAQPCVDDERLVAPEETVVHQHHLRAAPDRLRRAGRARRRRRTPASSPPPRRPPASPAVRTRATSPSRAARSRSGRSRRGWPRSDSTAALAEPRGASAHADAHRGERLRRSPEAPFAAARLGHSYSCRPRVNRERGAPVPCLPLGV